MPRTALIIVADDYGLSPAYDAGILEAARAGAIDAVSVIVTGAHEPAALLDSGVAAGLHLALEGWSGEGAGRGEGAKARGAGPGEREAAVAALSDQLERFSRAFGGPPAHLDGHHHCHAAPGLGAALARQAARLGLPVRSVSASHRRTLRCLGAATPDRLVGRLSESEPAIPAELEPLVREEGEPPSGVIEWMVHPGHRDPEARSSYDAGREEDLRLVLELAGSERVRALRTTHAEALG